MIWYCILAACIVSFMIFDNYQKKLQNTQRIKRSLQYTEQKVIELTKNKEDIERSYLQNFCAIDVETTGLKFASSRVIQVSLVLFHNGSRAGSRNFFINPGVKVPVNATKVNKITNSMLFDQPTFSEIQFELYHLINKYPLVGHNLYFDVMMLRSEFEKLGTPFSPKILFCTMKKSAHIFAEEQKKFARRSKRSRQPYREPWLKLAVAAQEFGLEPKGELHDARVDADLAGRLYIAMRTQEAQAAQEYLDLMTHQLDALKAEQATSINAK